MKYSYKFEKDVEAVQFKGDGTADLIELTHFLGETPDIIYPENKGTPYFVIQNDNGKLSVVRLSDFIIKNPFGNYVAVPYQAFIKLYHVI